MTGFLRELGYLMSALLIKWQLQTRKITREGNLYRYDYNRSVDLSWNCSFIQIVVKTEQNFVHQMESSTLDLLPNDQHNYELRGRNKVMLNSICHP
jgi:hypothetical protein